jgi:hypothetical protein
MAAKRHAPRADKAEQEKRERELDAWLDRALHAPKQDPTPDVHDV